MASHFTTHNMEDGFCEAFVRGLRSTFLTDVQYANLKEGGSRGAKGGREDFEDMKLALQDTDYGNFLSAEPALDPKIIGTRATGKWVKELKYIRASATGSLAKFLDFISYEYVIDNILDLIKAATSASAAAIDVEALLEGCHPFGMLEAGVMKSILAFEDLGEAFKELYYTILVDTPVGKYFTQFLQENMDERATADPDSVRSTFAEIPIALVENSVKKFWMEDFYRFCTEDIGGETGAVMGEMLSLRADQLAIQITHNSLSGIGGAGGALGDGRAGGAAAARTSRAALYPTFGRLYPSGTEALARVEDEDALRRVLASTLPEYAALWDAAPVDARGVKDVSDAFFRAHIHALELAFEGQFHYAVFYAYAKLKEQEAKNVAWIATCLEHGVYGEMDRIIPIFSRAGKPGAAAGGRH